MNRVQVLDSGILEILILRGGSESGIWKNPVISFKIDNKTAATIHCSSLHHKNFFMSLSALSANFWNKVFTKIPYDDEGKPWHFEHVV